MQIEPNQINGQLNDDGKPSGNANSKDNKQTVFVLVEYYLPGFKAGGPIRSVANIIQTLNQEFSFKVITSDRDYGDEMPYPRVAQNRWVRLDNTELMYLSPGWRGLYTLIKQLWSMDGKYVLYINSFFSRRYSMLPMLLRCFGLIHPACVVLAPRGEFSPGALNLKRRRKHIYITISRWLGIYRKIIFHASSYHEEVNIGRILTGETDCASIPAAMDLPGIKKMKDWQSVSIVAGNISSKINNKEQLRQRKKPGRLRIVFISRISPMKNLIGALKILVDVTGDVTFDIYGPMEDRPYWNECQKVIGALPNNVKAKYMGMVQPEKVGEVFVQHDLLFLPTFGENYGHVICEALEAGCPVLISDQTPWNDVEEYKAGWSISLFNKQQYHAVIQRCVDADDKWRTEISACAKEYIEKHLSNGDVIESNRSLFRLASRIAHVANSE